MSEPINPAEVLAKASAILISIANNNDEEASVRKHALNAYQGVDRVNTILRRRAMKDLRDTIKKPAKSE